MRWSQRRVEMDEVTLTGAGHCHCCHCWRLVSWSVTWQIVTQIIVPMMELLCVGFTRFLGQLLRLLALRVAMSGPAAWCGLIVVEGSPQQRCLHPDYCQPAIDSNNWLSVVSSMTFNRKSVFLSSLFYMTNVFIVKYIIYFHPKNIDLCNSTRWKNNVKKVISIISIIPLICLDCPRASCNVML